MNRIVRIISSLLLFFLVSIVAMEWGGGRPAAAQSDDPPTGPSAQSAVYIVQRGDTLYGIADQYAVTVEALMRANGVPDPRQIYVGQRLVIPTAAISLSLVNAEGGDAQPIHWASYMFQAGDTLFSVAKRYGLTWQIVAQVNKLLSPQAVWPGLVIRVPVSSPAIEPVEGDSNLPSGATATGYGIPYFVRPGDTALRIALAHGVSTWALAVNNHIANPALIYPGQELMLPGTGTGLPSPFLAIETTPVPVTQGSTLVIAVRTTVPVSLTGRLFEQEVRFAEEDGVYYGLVGVHVFAEPTLYDLELTAIDEGGFGTTMTTGILVAEGRFNYERIDVPYGRSQLLDPTLIAQDHERLESVRHLFTTPRMWSAPFQRPCVGPISAYFGAHRSYNGGPYTSYHSGVDFRAPGGTPVHAAAAGTVVLAEQLSLWGNAVVIDHGWGVLTGYAHLSAIHVTPGQQVTAGEVIAEVGNTGLSTGAHLHWEMWVGGTSVDALQWLDPALPWPASEWRAIGG
ncbi:MAG TPA: LysM peptidoglycan-binding domain-containing protein [Chloroflexi bacterium]|nr:LysM peptidoglycan-binding domain-containing protein [Chloroflexota bacterium]